MSERGGAATRDLHRRDQRPRNRRMTSSTADTAPTAPFYRIDWRQRSRVYCSGVQRHASPAVAIRSAANSTAVGQTPALSPSGYPPQIRQSISKLLSLSLLVPRTTHMRGAANGWENRKFPAQPSRLHWMTARQLRVRSTFEAFCSSCAALARRLVHWLVFLSARAATANVQTGVCISLRVLSDSVSVACSASCCGLRDEANGASTLIATLPHHESGGTVPSAASSHKP